jgi:hypothetical protein
MPADECASLRPQCFEKSLDRLDAKKSIADLIIFKQSGQRAHTNQIITYQSLRHANEKYEMGTFALFSKRNPRAAAADSENNFFHQIRSSMRKRNPVLNCAGVRTLASEHLFQKDFWFPDLFVGREKLDEPANCVFLRPRAQFEIDMFFIKQVGKQNRHEEDLLDSLGKAVIQLTEQPWQLKTLRP